MSRNFLVVLTISLFCKVVEFFLFLFKEPAGDWARRWRALGLSILLLFLLYTLHFIRAPLQWRAHHPFLLVVRSHLESIVDLIMRINLVILEF